MGSTRLSLAERPGRHAAAAWSVLGLLALFLSLAGCQPTSRPVVLSGTYESTLLPSSSTPPSPSATAQATRIPYPPPLPTLYPPEYPYPAPAQQQPGLTLIAPMTNPTGASTQPGALSGTSDCGDIFYMRIEDMPDGSLNLTLLSGGDVRWQWTEDPLASQYSWQEIQPLQNMDLYQTMAFYGLDRHGQWWLSVVSELCGETWVSALMPVNDPRQVIPKFYSPSGKPPYVYWLLEEGTMIAYRQVNGQAVPVFTMSGAPGSVFSVWSDSQLSDLNSDGAPELYLRWGEPHDTSLFQILTQQGDGYRLIAEVEPVVQFADLDGDGVSEFLRPQGGEPPSRWDVYDWVGDNYELVDTLQRPGASQPLYPGETNLPRLPTDLYFWHDDSWWVWPNTGGAIQSSDQPSPGREPDCSPELPEQQSVSWSPDCRYVVLSIPGAVEGASNVLLDVQTGREIPIDGSFVYARGMSTYAWDPGSRYLIHARVDGGEGLYRVRLPGGEVEPLISMNDEVGIAPPAYFFGAVDPVVLPGGSIGFAVEGFQEQLYPPPGVYRLDTDGRLHMLAEVPLLAHSPDDLERSYPARVHWSPDGSMFLYVAPTSADNPNTDQTILLGKADGGAVWDVTRILKDARNFQWRGAP